MKIEVGKYYRTREGNVERIVSGPDDDEDYFTDTGYYRGARYFVNEVAVTDVEPPLEIKDGDHVRTDQGLEFGPVRLCDKSIWFLQRNWNLDGGVTDVTVVFGNIVEVIKRGSDEK